MSDTTGTDSPTPTSGGDPSDNGSNKTWLWVALAVVVVVVIGLAVAAIAGNPDDEDDDPEPPTTVEASTIPSTTVAETTTTTTEPTDAEQVTVEGTGATNSDPFTLTVERYKVEYSFPGDCSYTATLESTDPAVGYSEEIGSGSALEGETNLFGITEGQYYVAMTQGEGDNCDWKIVLTPA